MRFKILTFMLDFFRKLLSSKYIKYTIITLFVIVVTVISGPFIANTLANVMYKNSNFATAEKIWSISSKLSLYDNYVMYYNSGNALYRQSNIEQAVNKYEESIKISPESKICQIKWNASQALIELGRDSEVSEPADAIGYYSRALFHLSYQACLDNPQYSEQFKKLTKELEDKINQINERLKEKRNNSEYKPEPDFKKPTDEDRANERRERLHSSKSGTQSDERSNLSQEDRDKMYNESWW